MTGTALSGRHVEFAIVGAGFSGVGMAIRLKRAGRDSFVLFERGLDLGGTWWENTYPGCACDVPSHLYSYSFEPNPDWSRAYSTQAEIQAYIRGCADKHGVTPHIRFGTTVTAAAFDEAAGLWKVTTDAGEVVTARFLVAAMGPLSRPLLPDIEGLASFAGTAFHSAHWDRAYDFKGKRVAVIGTGASAIQFVPRIAKKTHELLVFQRTPPWIVPRPDRAISGLEQWIFRWLPFAQRLHRLSLYWRLEMFALGFVVNPRFMKLLQRLALKNLADNIPDPALRRILTPDYTMGCKRVLLSNDYYPALAQDNVRLITQGISRITPRGVVTADGTEHEVDAIVYGTGFDAARDLISPMKITGVTDGDRPRDLARDWQAGPEAYLGTTIAGYPNLFFLVGPNTGLGHNSIIFMLEAQLNLVMGCLRHLERRDKRVFDTRRSRQEAYNARLQRDLKKTVWSSGCRSWYQYDADKITTLWSGFSFSFWWKTLFFRPRDFIFGD